MFGEHTLLVILTVKKLLKRVHKKSWKTKNEFRDKKLIERKNDKLYIR